MDVASSAKQEIRVRSSGRDDKGEGGASGECGGRTEAVFIAVEKHSQGRTADTADLSTTLRSGRDDKGEGGASGECGGRTEAVFITVEKHSQGRSLHYAPPNFLWRPCR